jgi:hypothetical protein
VRQISRAFLPASSFGEGQGRDEGYTSLPIFDSHLGADLVLWFLFGVNYNLLLFIYT